MTHSHAMSYWKMIFEKGKYYHLYNRSNNQEKVFLTENNYVFFLEKIRRHLLPHCTIISYCLMPTHFHLLIRIETDGSLLLSNQIAIMLRSYTRAINKHYSRHGSLFQQNTKCKLIDDESYLITLINYIHQNPLRAKLIQNMDGWKYSSYSEVINHNNSSIVDNYFLLHYFKTVEEFKKYSEEMISSIKKEYWVS